MKFILVFLKRLLAFVVAFVAYFVFKYLIKSQGKIINKNNNISDNNMENKKEHVYLFGTKLNKPNTNDTANSNKKDNNFANYSHNNEDIIDCEYEDIKSNHNENENNYSCDSNKISENSELSKYRKELCIIVDNCRDLDIKSKIEELIKVMKNMEQYISQNKRVDADINLFYEYYVPEIIKNTKTYSSLESDVFFNKHSSNMKEDLLEAINMVITAYNTILSECYDNIALSVSSSLDALKAGLKLKGFSK